MSRLRVFLEELKRRHVYKVAAVYAVVAWVVIQIAATALPYLMAKPDLLIRATIIVALAGFPVALVLGWVFDVTPEGVQRTDAQPEPVRRVPAAAPNRARIVAVGSLFVAAVAVGFALWYVRENTRGPSLTALDALGQQMQQQIQSSLQGAARLSLDSMRGAHAGPPVTGPDLDSLTGLADAIVAGLGKRGLAHAEGPLPAKMSRIAVFPFQEPEPGGAAKWGRLLADSLSAALNRAGFRTVDPAAVRKAAGDTPPDPSARAAAAAIARRLGADAFITGVATPQAGALVLDVMLAGVEQPDGIRRANLVMAADHVGGPLARLVSRLTARADTASTP